MKTARVPLMSALLILIAVLAWGGGALHGQVVQPRPTTKLDPALLDTYVGQYELAPKVLLTLRREGHYLLARVAGQPWIVVYAENETRFFWKVVPAQITIQKDKNGKVEGLLFEQGKTNIQAKRVSGELPEEVELPEPKEVVQSPRLITLTKDLQSGNREAIKQFWKEVQDKGPLVEPVKGDAHSSWVTLLWRGNDKTRRVSVTMPHRNEPRHFPHQATLVGNSATLSTETPVQSVRLAPAILPINASNSHSTGRLLCGNSQPGAVEPCVPAP